MSKIPHMEDFYFQSLHDKFMKDRKKELNSKMKKTVHFKWTDFFRAQRKTDLKVLSHGNNGVSI